MTRSAAALAAVTALAGASLCAQPASAMLKPGTKAPDFTAPAYLAGKPFTYTLSKSLKKGPVVVYFFPAAHTSVCNLEAHLFSEAIDDFKKQGASVIGVTASGVEGPDNFPSELAKFSKETEHCGGKFPVAADVKAQIAKSFDAPLIRKDKTTGEAKAVDGMSGRTSYVLAPDGTVIHAYDNLAADDHVSQTLSAVKAWRASHKR